MPKDLPLISIGMPVYNCVGTLHDAVSSILRQTFEDWELLILDDGSTDGTSELARSFTDHRIRVVSDGENKGLAVRLNEAVRVSKGVYFARMDGDDISYPHRLSRQMDYLSKHPKVDLLGAWVVVFNQKGSGIGVRRFPEAHTEICNAPWSGFPVVHPTFMARKSWFEQNPYHQNMRKAQDQILLSHVYSKSCFANVPEVLLGYREELPSLKKALSSRWYLMKGMFGAYIQKKKLLLACLSGLVQLMKLLLDVVATPYFLRRLQISRRSQEPTKEEAYAWQAVVSDLEKGQKGE